MYSLSLLFFAASSTFALPSSPSGYGGGSGDNGEFPNTPQCSDGGTLHCCQASFTGNAAPVALAADLLCYDLTPAVDNCIITEAPSDPDTGCVGQPLCCQVNTLSPVLGLFCSKPPGDCQGKEGGQPPYCLDVIDNRFGNCTESDVNRQRGSLGLGPIGDTLEGVADGGVGTTVKGITGPVLGSLNAPLKPVGGAVNGVVGSLSNSGSSGTSGGLLGTG